MIGKQRILIVDDDENIAELISLYLTKECFDTKIVFNGEDALSTFETYEPNLILLDLMLPGIDGYQVCRGDQGKIRRADYYAFGERGNIRQSTRSGTRCGRLYLKAF